MDGVGKKVPTKDLLIRGRLNCYREDKITGLRNRFGLTDDCEKLVGHEICILMIDIDHFKKFNDTYGHIVGDRVLIDIANALKEAFSPGLGYRFGGDELMVILKDLSEAEVLYKIDLFKKKIDEIDISEIGHKVTCSVGYAFGHVDNTEDFIEVNRRADNKLYESKKLRPEWNEKESQSFVRDGMKRKCKVSSGME